MINKTLCTYFWRQRTVWIVSFFFFSFFLISCILCFIQKSIFFFFFIYACLASQQGPAICIKKEKQWASLRKDLKLLLAKKNFFIAIITRKDLKTCKHFNKSCFRKIVSELYCYSHTMTKSKWTLMLHP